MFSVLKEKAEFYFLDTESVVVYAATASLEAHIAKMP